MKYLILSDIHSNLEAFNVVLDYGRKIHADQIYCAGDIVGYAADPQECIRLIRSNKIQSVAGNHDYAVSGRLDALYFTKDGKEAIHWTRNNLSFEDINFLLGLEFVINTQDFSLVHATLNQPSLYIYMDEISKAHETFALMQNNVCFVGHTHEPTIYVKQNDNIYQISNNEIEFVPGNKYIVNVGSVGQPRDGNPMASFCVYDTQTSLLELKRLPYPLKQTQKKILQSGLPTALASRLETGH